MESEVLKAENDRKLREMKLEADISVENQRKLLIEEKTENDKIKSLTRSSKSSISRKYYLFYGCSAKSPDFVAVPISN